RDDPGVLQEPRRAVDETRRDDPRVGDDEGPRKAELATERPEAGERAGAENDPGAKAEIERDHPRNARYYSHRCTQIHTDGRKGISDLIIRRQDAGGGDEVRGRRGRRDAVAEADWRRHGPGGGKVLAAVARAVCDRRGHLSARLQVSVRRRPLAVVSNKVVH